MTGVEATAARILVVDDEAQIRRFLRISLKSQGYEVIEAENAADGIACAATQTPDLVVLDLGLPDADGKTVLSEIRAWSSVPVIVLSVRASESEKVLVFDHGANDYVTKPFGIQEFLARVRNLLRQHVQVSSAPRQFDDGHLHVDLAKRRIVLRGELVHLTRKEYSLLQALLTHPSQVNTQSQLLRDIWGPTHSDDTHYLRVLVGKLRQKLGDNPNEPQYIETEPGVGYRFVGDGVRQMSPASRT